MTNAPSDLLGFRRTVMSLTGLTNPIDVGIVGDGAHQGTGGYHEGMDVLVAIGRYHPPVTANIGSSTEDYSVRTVRDRRGLTDSASAVDVGDNWPRGGRTAWIRWNNIFVGALRGNDPALAAIRAVNYISVDGGAKHRTDREHNWAIESSTDSVDIHTHVEWYRDTEGHRQVSFDRMSEFINQAIGGKVELTGDQAKQLLAVNEQTAAFMQGEHTVSTPWASNPNGIAQITPNQKLDELLTKVDALTPATPGTIDYGQLADALMARGIAKGIADQLVAHVQITP